MDDSIMMIERNDDRATGAARVNGMPADRLDRDGTGQAALS
jgi:hypothetical protein